jgi:hypothetical protein
VGRRDPRRQHPARLMPDHQPQNRESARPHVPLIMQMTADEAIE